jgi:hypothetical protein
MKHNNRHTSEVDREKQKEDEIVKMKKKHDVMIKIQNLKNTSKKEKKSRKHSTLL